MKNILLLFFVLVIVFTYGCSKEETAPTGKITATTYKVEEVEVTEDTAEEERENITTVRLCHDTDNGILKFEEGSVFGFYDNATRFEFNDYCQNKNYLWEFHCENETPKQRIFLCRNGCVDNHCA